MTINWNWHNTTVKLSKEHYHPLRGICDHIMDNSKMHKHSISNAIYTTDCV